MLEFLHRCIVLERNFTHNTLLYWLRHNGVP
jgi:hypothetical protein